MFLVPRSDCALQPMPFAAGIPSLFAARAADTAAAYASSSPTAPAGAGAFTPSPGIMMSEPAEKLRHSWDVNAGVWTAVVRDRQIESRRVATDAAIVQAVLRHQPRRVLDVGCGEGWLARALATEGVAVVGMDASGPLIESARERGGGTFHHLSYEELAAAPEQVGKEFDAVVCNFSLLEEEIAHVLSALRGVAGPGGRLILQTVHPWSACGEADYRSGWRTEQFAGFGDRFAEPMPWYFRTLASWIEVLRAADWQVLEVKEPAHPDTGNPLSLLVVCSFSRP